MAKYRKKPIEVEAVQLTEHNAAWLASWCSGTAETRSAPGPKYWYVVMVETLEGTVRTDPGDWIIKSGEGEFYPCKNSIFEATYERATL